VTQIPPIFAALQELENQAPGTWYVNILATYPEHRGKGLATRLLGAAERLAAETRRTGLSLIVVDANAEARRLYARFGFRDAASRPMVKDGWEGRGEYWLLLTKPLR
jgi:ribosomal protein S18 acetylase RimI-like enzyme